MFKQIKSAVFWYYLFKFRKRLTISTALLIIAFFSNAIYADIVEYLKLTDQIQYLKFALFLKWFIIVFNLSFSVYLLLNILKKEPKELKKETKEKYSKKEQELLKRPKLQNKADFIIKNKLQ